MVEGERRDDSKDIYVLSSLGWVKIKDCKPSSIPISPFALVFRDLPYLMVQYPSD